MWINRTALAAGIFLFLALVGIIVLSGCAAPDKHDAQWATVIENFGGRAQKVNGFIEDTLKNPDSERKFSTQEGEVVLATKGFGGAGAMVLAVNGEAYSAFPIIDSNSYFKAEIGSVAALDNGLEAYVWAGLDGPSVNYFAVDYAYNKDKYAAFEGKEVEFLLWGFGYNVKETHLPETKPITADKYWYGKGFTMLLPDDSGNGNYKFAGVVKGVREVKAFGSDAFILETKIVQTMDGAEVVIPILVLKSKFEGMPQVDDGVEGRFWISGKLADGEK